MNFQKLGSELESGYLNETKASQYIGLSVCALRSRNARGDIGSTKLGHSRFYRRSDLDNFMARFGAEIRLRQSRAAGGTRRITKVEFASLLANEAAASLGGK